GRRAVEHAADHAGQGGADGVSGERAGRAGADVPGVGPPRRTAGAERAASDLRGDAGGVRGSRRLGAGAPGYCVGELWDQGRSAKDRFWIQAEWSNKDVPGGFAGDGCGRGEGARVQLSRVAGGIAAGGGRAERGERGGGGGLGWR